MESIAGAAYYLRACLACENYFFPYLYQNLQFQAQYLDVICFNRYNGWYAATGQLINIAASVVEEATAWYRRFNKPIIMSEYGADTLAGLHLVSGFACIMKIEIFIWHIQMVRPN